MGFHFHDTQYFIIRIRHYSLWVAAAMLVVVLVAAHYASKRGR